jgi:hypothetical protein
MPLENNAAPLEDNAAALLHVKRGLKRRPCNMLPAAALGAHLSWAAKELNRQGLILDVLLAKHTQGPGRWSGGPVSGPSERSQMIPAAHMQNCYRRSSEERTKPRQYSSPESCPHTLDHSSGPRPAPSVAHPITVTMAARA